MKSPLTYMYISFSGCWRIVPCILPWETDSLQHFPECVVRGQWNPSCSRGLRVLLDNRYVGQLKQSHLSLYGHLLFLYMMKHVQNLKWPRSVLRWDSLVDSLHSLLNARGRIDYLKVRGSFWWPSSLYEWGSGNHKNDQEANILDLSDHLEMKTLR